MIDLYARDIGAAALEEFLEGSITNEEYEEKYPRSENDPALREIYLQVWFFYSDIKKHKLIGKNSLNDEQSKLVERCILFLKSDLEFEWRPQKLRPLQGILRLFGFERETEEMDTGDKDVWPFYTVERYESMAVATTDNRNGSHRG